MNLYIRKFLKSDTKHIILPIDKSLSQTLSHELKEEEFKPITNDEISNCLIHSEYNQKLTFERQSLCTILGSIKGGLLVQRVTGELLFVEDKFIVLLADGCDLCESICKQLKIE